MIPLPNKNLKRATSILMTLSLLAMTGAAFSSTSATIGTIASNITSTFSSVAKLITAGSYIAGLAFALTAVMKFKAHKDNPNQVPIGTPIGLTFIAAALLFMPSILSVSGYTIFGTGGGSVAGPTGTVFSSGSGGSSP